MPDDDPHDIERAALRLARQGVAVVLLRDRTKRPIAANWSTLPRMTPDVLARRLHPGMNIGIRLGEVSEVGRRRYVYAFDIDVRDRDNPRRAAREAWNALTAVFPEARSWPRSISGSGGESRHAFIASDGCFRKRSVARAGYTVFVEGKEKPGWEVDFYGAGVQVVAAPSIHPDTGERYRWEDGEPDFTRLPFVRRTEIALLFERKTARRDRRDFAPEPIDDLRDMLDTKALDNTGGGLCYDDWRDVLFAVKQEYDGTDTYDEALEVVEEWSQLSDKHDQVRFEEVWDHARTDRPDGITLGTLKKKTFPEIDERRKAAIVAEMVDERPAGAATPRPTPPAGERPEWARDAILDGMGAPVDCAENRRLFLLHVHPMEFLVWAEEEQRVVWRKPAGSTPPAELRDVMFGEGDCVPYNPGADYQILQMLMRKKPFYFDNTRKEAVNDSVRLVAPQRPWARLRELLTQERWDGVARVDHLLQDYLGVEDSPYARAVSRLLVLGPMCRALWRGVKVDYAPVLESPWQGNGKDRFLETLCTFGEQRLYTASSLDLSKPAEYVQIMRGKLIVHLAEMAVYNKHDLEQIKAFITEHEDTARLPYEPAAQTYRRTGIFVFSTNATGGYLRDATGNRRFLPVRCGDPMAGPDGKPTAYAKMFDELRRVQPQIWAEAHEMAREEAERQGGRVRELLLPAEALQTAIDLQEQKRGELPEEDMAARATFLLDYPVPLDDIIAPDARTDGTARKMAVRNQVCGREFWVQVLGEKKDQFGRNSPLAFRALDMLEHWERVPGRQRHLGEVRIVYRRRGTNGKPRIIDDVASSGRSNVVSMQDERRKPERRRR